MKGQQPSAPSFTTGTSGERKQLPDEEIEEISADTDDLQGVGQKPITFLRQLVALVTCPSLFKSLDIPGDAKSRAARILNSCYGHSIGSYTDGPGIEVIRNDVSNYITARDGGIGSNLDDVFLSEGAAGAIESVLTMMITGNGSPNQTGIMLPVPGYPLFKSLSASLGFYPIPYFLDEENGWEITDEELTRAFDLAQDHCQPRAIVVINPNNPTGQVLSRNKIEGLIRFAKEKKLFLIADEVYQQNIFVADAYFCSFKKALLSMGQPYEDMELASFMSASKGLTFECGFRGGCCEVVNIDPEVKKQLFKIVSTKSCSSVPGQVAIDVVAYPPQPGEQSYLQFKQETLTIMDNFRRQAVTVLQFLNTLDGISCVPPSGAMFAFPRLHLPEKAILEAKEKQLRPDEMYCYELRKETGICLRPGSEFGQKQGHYHFRLTILPSPLQMDRLLRKLKDFHYMFMSQYST